MAGGYDTYSANPLGYGGNKGKGSETGCPPNFVGIGHDCYLLPTEEAVLFDEMISICTKKEAIPHIPINQVQNAILREVLGELTVSTKP